MPFWIECDSSSWKRPAHLSTFPLFLNWRAQNCTQNSTWGCTNTKYSRTVPSCPAGSAVSGTPRDAVCPLGCRAHCWLLLNLLPTSLPQSLSAGLLFSHSSPNSYLCLALFGSQVQNLAFVLACFLSLMNAQCSSLSRPRCKASCFSRESSAPPSFWWHQGQDLTWFLLDGKTNSNVTTWCVSEN